MSPESHLLEPSVREPELVRLSVAAVARRLGVAPGTLRTWDRRYGLGPTERSVGEHRKYSKADLARLLYMHKLVISGVSPAEAAQLAVSHVAEVHDLEFKALPLVDTELVDALLRAAQALDRNAVEQIIRSRISEDGTVLTWTNLLVPMLSMIGEEWERSGQGIASEHMVSEVIKSVLSERVVVERPRNEVPALLACVGEELHSLAITALAAALAENGIQVQFLGARTPVEAIAEVVRRSAPAAIFLWAQLPENALIAKMATLPVVRPTPQIILGGPGWEGTEWEGAVFAPDLIAACDEISQALGLHSGAL